MIIANMATFPARADCLPAAVERLSDQVDRLNLCLNEYQEVPSWISDFENVHAVIPDMDLKDLGKFLFPADDQDDVLLVDDDIAYPDDYVRRTIGLRNRLEREGCRNAVVGYHGTTYLRFSPVLMLKDALLRRSLTIRQLGRAKRFHPFHAGLGRPLVVTQLGTGTVLARGRHLPALDAMLGADRRADVRFARWCFEHGVTQVALPRKAGWMPDCGPDDTSIYTTYTRDLPSEFLDELKSFAFKVPGRGLPLRPDGRPQ